MKEYKPEEWDEMKKMKKDSSSSDKLGRGSKSDRAPFSLL